MLSPFDDHPVHQLAEPVTRLATSDRNAFERYRFFGFDAPGGVLFGVTLACYPNREIVDASLSVVIDGVQHSVHATARSTAGERPTAVGPFAVEVPEPLRTLVVRCTGPQADELGIDAALTFTAAAPPVEHRGQRERADDRVHTDRACFSQWGTWSGHLTVDDTRLEIDPRTHVAQRERSWGIEPVGEPVGGAPRLRLPQRAWIAAAAHFARTDLHTATVEDELGRARHADAQRVSADEVAPEPLRDHAWAIEWQPATRRPAAATLRATPWNGPPFEVALVPVAAMALRGLGSHSPDWGHGSFKAEAAVGRERWIVADLDPTDVHNLHWLQVCHAAGPDGDGVGLLEVLPLGPHRPSGLTGFTDGAGRSA